MRSRSSALLLLVAAVSVAAGSGRKPAKDQQAAVSLRRISASEVMGILNQFPGMLPGQFAARRNDTAFLRDLFPFSEVTSASLEHALPGVRFYKGLNFRISPPYPYLMAIAGSRRLMMPGEFNQLLLACGLKVTDENVIELAEAFVIVAVGAWANEVPSYPQIDFLETKKSRLKPDVWTSDAAVLKVRVGEHMEKWHFDVLRNQFVAAGSRSEKGLRRDYTPSMVDSLPGRGQLNLTPNTAIEASLNDARAERDSLRTGLASGGKPGTESIASPVRMLTDSEAVQVGRRFPALGVRPGGISLVRDDLLDHLFPKSAFYKILRGGRPPSPRLISTTGDSVFPMPSGFNLLLREQDIEVTDDNILDMAKAFVIIAMANGPLSIPIDEFSPLDFIPRITFLGGQRIEQRDLRNPYAADAQITCRVDGDEIQTWEFSQARDKTSNGVRVKVGQFGAVRVAVGGKALREYLPVTTK